LKAQCARLIKEKAKKLGEEYKRASPKTSSSSEGMPLPPPLLSLPAKPTEQEDIKPKKISQLGDTAAGGSAPAAPRQKKKFSIEIIWNDPEMKESVNGYGPKNSPYFRRMRLKK